MPIAALGPILMGAAGTSAAATAGAWGALGAGAGLAGNLIGSSKQADATTQSAQIQNAFNEKALAAAQEQLQWQRAQYANYLQRMQPYSNLGLSAGTTLGNLLARSPYASYANGPGNAAPIMSQGNPGNPPTPIALPTGTDRYPQAPGLPNVQY